MSFTIRYGKKHAKAKKRRRLKAQERLARDRLQAQHAATVLEQALHDLGLPADLVVEIEGRLRSQQKLLGKIVGMMCPPLFGCRTNSELCRVRGRPPGLTPDGVLGVVLHLAGHLQRSTHDGRGHLQFEALLALCRL